MYIMRVTSNHLQALRLPRLNRLDNSMQYQERFKHINPHCCKIAHAQCANHLSRNWRLSLGEGEEALLMQKPVQAWVAFPLGTDEASDGEGVEFASVPTSLVNHRFAIMET